MNKTGLSGFVWWLNHHFIILLPVVAQGKKCTISFIAFLLKDHSLPCYPSICKQLILLSFQSNKIDHNE